MIAADGQRGRSPHEESRVYLPWLSRGVLRVPEAGPCPDAVLLQYVYIPTVIDLGRRGVGDRVAKDTGCKPVTHEVNIVGSSPTRRITADGRRGCNE